METTINLVEELYERGETYSKTSIKLAKLKGIETFTVVVSALIWRLSVIITFSLFALVINIGIALWLGGLMGESYYGFFIVAAFYLFTALIFHSFLHNWIKKPLSELIITQALNYNGQDKYGE